MAEHRISAASRQPAAETASLARLLDGYSIEVTTRDADSVIGKVAAGTEVFIANLPRDGADAMVAAAARLHRAGLVPVPHLAARKIGGRAEFDALVARLAGEAGVERVLALGGDRDEPAGSFSDSLQLIETGAFEKHGISRISVACYPEGHPRIGAETLRAALKAKLAALAGRGLEARLVSQFAFEAEPVLELARQLRADGIAAPLRIGAAGPAPRATLIKYALRCGVGASLRTLRDRSNIVTGLFGADTPHQFLDDIAAAIVGEPELGIEGIHFFTFGAPERSAEWAREARR